MTTEAEEDRQLRIAHPLLERLLRLWNLRRADRRLPRRGDFLPEADLWPWMGHLAIVAVERHPLRFRVRLAGTELAAYAGADFTGRHLDEMISPHLQDEVLSPYHACLREQLPQYTTFVPQLPEPTYRRLHRLLLPCSNDGRDIDQMIVGIYADGWDPLRHRSIYDSM